MLVDGSGIEGVGRLAGGLAKIAAKLAMRGDGLSEKTVRWIVNDMRARVPVDTGALLNSIRAWREGAVWVITADARNPRDGADYGYWVEYGTAARVVTRGTFDSAHDPAGHPGTTAQPFFWPAVEAGLERRDLDLADVIEGLPGEAGLD